MDPFVRPGMKFGPQVEHLVTRYPGTGGPDTSKYDWATNMQRDTLASMVSHHDLLCGLAIADNTSLARQRVQLLDKMRQPCGKRPQDMDEDHDENEIKSTAESAKMASRQGLSPSAAEFTPKQMYEMSSTSSPEKPHRVLVSVGTTSTLVVECDLVTFNLNELFLEVALGLGTTDLTSFTLSYNGTPLKASWTKAIDVGIGNCATVGCQLTRDLPQGLSQVQVQAQAQAQAQQPQQQQQQQAQPQPPLMPAQPQAQPQQAQQHPMVNSPVVQQIHSQLHQLQQQQQYLQQQKLQAQIAQSQAAMAQMSGQAPSPYNQQMMQHVQYTLAINLNQLKQMQIASEWSLPVPPPLPSAIGSPAVQSAYATPPPMQHSVSAYAASPIPPPSVQTTPVPSQVPVPVQSPAQSTPPAGGSINLTVVAPSFSTYALMQNGSRALIEELQNQPSPAAIDMIIDNLNEVAGLTTNRLSSEVMRHLVNVCTPDQSRRIVAKFCNEYRELLEMADSVLGCEVLLQLVDNLRHVQCDEVDSLLRTVASSILPFAMSTHSARKMLVRLLRDVKADKAVTDELWQSIIDHLIPAAKDSKGCVTMKKCVDVAPPQVRQEMERVIIAAADELVIDQYGNYLLQHIVYNSKTADVVGLQLVPKLTAYCTNKIASHVVERVLQRCSMSTCQAVVKKIIAPAVLDKIIKDQYGNYIVQCAIERVPAEMLADLKAATAPHLSASQFGHKIEQKLGRRMKDTIAAALAQVHALQAAQDGTSTQPPVDPTRMEAAAAAADAPNAEPPTLAP